MQIQGQVGFDFQIDYNEILAEIYAMMRFEYMSWDLNLSTDKWSQYE